MKRVLAISFLFVFLIAYITPITSVQATEVTWGDNNSTYLSDEEFYTCRQLATLDIISQLCSNGVNELTIDNAESVDDFIINFLEYVDENAQNTVSDIYDVCTQLKDNIDYKANEIGTAFKSIGEDLNNSFNDLIDWFDGLTSVKKIEYVGNPNLVPLLNRLSRIESSSNTPTPQPDPDYSWVSNVNNLIVKDSNNIFHDFYSSNFSNQEYGYAGLSPYPLRSMSYVGNDGYFTTNHTMSTGTTSSVQFTTYNPIDVYLTVNENQTCSMVCSASNFTKFTEGVASNARRYSCSWYGGNNTISVYVTSTQIYYPLNQNFNSLDLALNYVYGKFSNINLYVNSVPWALVTDTPTNVTININGMDFYGNRDNEPITYYYPKGTQIDYKKLYDVIKRAIDNSTSINNQTIWEGDTYYDSHDNVYTPTIYNYYSDDDNESESDVLEDIINLAIIPKFDTALLQPIEVPLSNGEKIMFLGVQSLPEDILFVIGAGFVLILFGAMINRLIE